MTQTRNTIQKKIINQEIDDMKTFFSAEDLLKKVSLKDKKISIATIYRHLKTLRKNEEIYSYSCLGKTVYSNTKRSHCHFLCTKTGKVIHFDIKNLDFLKNNIPGEIESFQIEVKGTYKNSK